MAFRESKNEQQSLCLMDGIPWWCKAGDFLNSSVLITEIADEIGVGVHFNPFVSWNSKTVKYGVVRMHDLIEDILHWDRFYLSGRLQKPVNILADSLDVQHINSFNLRAATSAALLLLSSNLTEEDLYAKICSLSYIGDVRMLFAEDRHKVKKIVEGQFNLFRTMYNPILEEFAEKDLLRLSSGVSQLNISQDCGLRATKSLISHLPSAVRSRMGMKLGEQERMLSGRIIHEVVIRSREEAAECMQKILRRRVMVASMRQAVSGILTVGGLRASRYLADKMRKAWKSWT